MTAGSGEGGAQGLAGCANGRYSTRATSPLGASFMSVCPRSARGGVCDEMAVAELEVSPDEARSQSSSASRSVESDRERVAQLIHGLGMVVVAPDLRTAHAILGRQVGFGPAPPSGAGPMGAVVRLGDLEIDEGHCRVCWRGKPLPLTSRERELLARLADDPGGCGAYAQLHAAAWTDRFIGEPAAVHAAIKRLRRKLPRRRGVGADRFGPRRRLPAHGRRSLDLRSTAFRTMPDGLPGLLPDRAGHRPDTGRTVAAVSNYDDDSHQEYKSTLAEQRLSRARVRREPRGRPRRPGPGPRPVPARASRRSSRPWCNGGHLPGRHLPGRVLPGLRAAVPRRRAPTTA